MVIVHVTHLLAISRNAFSISEGECASEKDYKAPKMGFSGACSREGSDSGQGQDKGMMRKTLSLGTKHKETPKNPVIVINILMQYF